MEDYPNRRRIGLEFWLLLAVTIMGWAYSAIFSAGSTNAQLSDIRVRVERIENILLDGRSTAR